MAGSSERHNAVLDELVEWWQDLSWQTIGSRAILVNLPGRWGRTTVLEKLSVQVEDDEALGIVIFIRGSTLPAGLGLQAQELRDLFRGSFAERRAAGLLGVDRLDGVIQLGLGIGGLFVSPLASLIGLLLASVGVGAAGKIWDDTAAGQEGAVARLGRAVAAVSVSVPVVVIIDDADQLDPDLAITMVESLIDRVDGRVLVVAAADPGSDLASALLSRTRYGLTAGRVLVAETDPDMSYQARADLAAELLPSLPGVAALRIGQRTRTFADVFAVTSAERLGELATNHGDHAVVAVVDEVINARPGQEDPSLEAMVLAWAGGVLHSNQTERALTLLGAQRPGQDPHVARLESLVRLTDPASPRLAEQVKVLAASTRHRLAAALLDEAVQLGANPEIGLVERVVALQAVHRVRADLVDDRDQLVSVQRQLIHGLEDLGEPGAYEIARTALTEYLASHPGNQRTKEFDELSTAVLRLARIRKENWSDPIVETAITFALAGGAAVGLEARIWAVIALLDQGGGHESALYLADQLTTELATLNKFGPVGDRWRLLLAFHLGRAGYLNLTQRILDPMLTATPDQWDAAQAVLFAVAGQGADVRLQIAALEAELKAVPAAAADDRLRLHGALGSNYERLGDYPRALEHGQHELRLRRQIQGTNHPDALTVQMNIGRLTCLAERPADALRLWQELLPHLEQVFGHGHINALGTRLNIASWTGYTGPPGEGVRLLRELLPDLERYLGRGHPDTLTAHVNLASQTGDWNPEEALRLSREVLPRFKQVMGPDHPDTLRIRSNIALWTGRCGQTAEELRLLQELLPDRERALGPDHPDTLSTRSDIAAWAGQWGQPAEALRLYQELLPHLLSVLGADHPDTLMVRSNIAACRGQCGQPAEALRLYQELLPHLLSVLGADHPDTLMVRSNIAAWTGRCGRTEEELCLLQELLPDCERLLGPDHPDTIKIRQRIRRLTSG